MIWNSEYLILSYPRAASHSLYVTAFKVMRPPIYGIVTAGQLRSLKNNCSTTAFYFKVGRGHESLVLARKEIFNHGRSLGQFRKIIVPVRDPFDLIWSQYNFMRAHYKNNIGNKNFELASQSDYVTFLKKYKITDLYDWLIIDGVAPRNLEPVFISNPSISFSKAFGLSDGDVIFPHINASGCGSPPDIPHESSAKIFEGFNSVFKTFPSQFRFNA